MNKESEQRRTQHTKHTSNYSDWTRHTFCFRGYAGEVGGLEDVDFHENRIVNKLKRDDTDFLQGCCSHAALLLQFSEHRQIDNTKFELYI